MKRLLLPLLAALALPTAVHRRVVYIVNHGRFNIEERFQDGKAHHQIWHMDISGKVQKLILKRAWI